MDLTIRRATTADVSTISLLVRNAVRWLGERGHDQWQHGTVDSTWRIATSVALGTTWVVVDDAGEAVATMTLDEIADPEFWKPEDDPKDALYLHRMVVSPTRSGSGIGAALVDWAGRKAAEAGKSLIRLDAWATNIELHHYYLQQKFRHVRTHRYAHRGSGALFERPVTVQTGRGPRLTERRQTGAGDTPQ